MNWLSHGRTETRKCKSGLPSGWFGRGKEKPRGLVELRYDADEILRLQKLGEERRQNPNQQPDYLGFHKPFAPWALTSITRIPNSGVYADCGRGWNCTLTNRMGEVEWKKTWCLSFVITSCRCTSVEVRRPRQRAPLKPSCALSMRVLCLRRKRRFRGKRGALAHRGGVNSWKN
jgi:hypothetical protein